MLTRAPTPRRAAAPPPRGSTVSATSAARFAAKVRRRRQVRWVASLGAVALLAAAGWLAVGSPWATVRAVEVRGTVAADPDAVRAAASSELGRPLLLARTGVVAARVAERERLVRSAQVRRRWPSTLVVDVAERRPAAAVPQSSGTAGEGTGWLLVDEDGVEIRTSARVPAGLPALRVDVVRAGPAVLQACLDVRRALPAGVLAQVRALGAQTPDRVWLDLTKGRRVEWGSAERSADKARVLQVLLARPAAVYDVRAPDAPALRRTR